MALKVFEKVTEAQSFVMRSSARELIGEFQKYAWSSFGFGDKGMWSSSLLLKFAYKLSGGSYSVKEQPAGPDSANIPESLVVSDETLFGSLEGESEAELLGLILSFYLGSTLSVGVSGGSSVSALCSRVSRFWDASANESDGRLAVGRCLDGFTLMESSGTLLRPLAVMLHRLGIRSRLGPFCGSGVQAATTKRRLVNYFKEFAPPSTTNGLICLAASPDDALDLFASHWSKESIEELETPEANALCSALGLSPTTSASAPRLLMLTLVESQSRVSGKSMMADKAVDDAPDTSAFLSAPALIPAKGPARVKQTGFTETAAAKPMSRQSGSTHVKRPVPLKLVERDQSEGSDSEIEPDSDSEEGDEDLARRLAALISPKSRKAKDKESLSSAANKVLITIPRDVRPQFKAMVKEHRLSVVSKQDLENLRVVFLQNKAAIEMFLSRRPISENMVQTGRASGTAFLPLYQNTRLGCPPHRCVLAEELMVRMSGGISLETSMAERQSKMKDESLRQEHTSLGDILVLLLDELHPAGVLELRAAERIMRRLVGLEIAAEKKAQTNQPIHKTMTELSEFMGTGMRVSTGVQDQTQK